tara:strand:+ start:4657 stop:5970 length:1314 start_codon:yes stop_codon:yes gene_type:complete
MMLRKKSLLIFGLLVTGLIGVVYPTSQSILLNQYASLEEDGQNLDRVTLAIQQELAQMDRSANDWGSWNSTYDFAEDRNDQYLREHITPTTYDSLGILLNVVLYYDPEGRVFFEREFDYHTHEWTEIPEGVGTHATTCGWLRPLDELEAINGLVNVEGWILTIVARHILTSASEGTSRGRIVMGRFQDAQNIAKLGETTQLRLEGYVWDNDLPLDVATAAKSLIETPKVVVPHNEDTLFGYTLLRDIYNEPVAILKATMPREVFKQGQATIDFFIVRIFLGGIVCIGVAVWFMDRSIIASLTRLVDRVRSTGDLSVRMQLKRSDEVLGLAAHMNEMLATVEEADSRLSRANTTLEERVKTRTEELAEANRKLEQEIEVRRKAQEDAESYGFPPLRRWAQCLSLQLSQFELDAIPTTLDNFSRLLEQVRDHAREPENA